MFNVPAEALLAAWHHVDLLACRGPGGAVVLRSVSRKAAERAACAVPVLPRAALETADALLVRAEAASRSS